MKANIKTIPEFNRRAKRLVKKYKSLKTDLQQLVASLQENPLQGIDLGGGIRKIRLAISSKTGGKSGGGRVITYAIKIADPDNYEVTLLTIYDKSEIANVTDTYTKELVQQVREQ